MVLEEAEEVEAEEVEAEVEVQETRREAENKLGGEEEH